MNASGRRGLAACTISAVLGTVGLLVGLSAPAARAGSGLTLTRLYGQSRYDTAAAVAEAAFPNGAPVVLLATGQDFPDALAGSYLAVNESGNAPILLTATTSLPAATASALTALKAREVIILGGDGAVSASVESALQGQGYTTRRVAGADRYQTMEALDTLGGEVVGTVNGSPTAVVTTGRNFPDALAAGPLTFTRSLPLVLTDGAQPGLSPEAASVLGHDHITQVILVGGPAALNPGINAQLQNMGIRVLYQTAGADRSATSVALADFALQTGLLSATRADVADGYAPSSSSTGAPGGFTPDALAGAVLGGINRAPTLVTDSPTDAGTTPGFFTAHAASETGGTVFGGPAAVSDQVVSAEEQAVATAPTTTTSSTSSTTSSTTSTTSTSTTTSSTSSTSTTSTTTPSGTSTTTTTVPPAGGTDPYTSGATGYDISFPQCGGAYPAQPYSIAVVGVNDGHPFSTNPCLASEAAWAGSHVNVYMNLASPTSGSGPAASGPAGTCAASDVNCQSFNYGYNSATQSLSAAQSAGASASTWWLDVEVANYWSSDTAANDQVVQGAISALDQAGKTVGVYSTPYMWAQIAGGWQPSTPEWAPGGTGSNPAGGCGGSYSFTTGPIWLSQYPSGNYDGDVAC